MTTPEPLEAPDTRAADPASGHQPVEPLRAERKRDRLRARASENPIVEWARAIALGIRDTAEDMLEEGRKGAHEAYDEGWKRFDAKTKHRRKP